MDIPQNLAASDACMLVPSSAGLGMFTPGLLILVIWSWCAQDFRVWDFTLQP